MTCLHHVPHAIIGNPFASGLRMQAPGDSSVKLKTPGNYGAKKSFSRFCSAPPHDEAVLEADVTPTGGERGGPVLIV